MAANTPQPPIIIVFGDEENLKSATLTRSLDQLLPPDVDRSLALTEYDGSRRSDNGQPSANRVREDLATLPFLSPLRVVLIRSADDFITGNRDWLDKYLEKPASTGCLILECRTLPKTTRLYKSTIAVGGQAHECKKLVGRALTEFVTTQAAKHNKSIDPSTAIRLVDLVGPDTGFLANELEKLALYATDRTTITDQDVSDLIGQSREEKIFAVLDSAALGRPAQALSQWHQVLATDPAAVYKSLGGMAFKVRGYLSAHHQRATGQDARTVASAARMWGRERDLTTILNRLSPPLLRRLLAALAKLDSQAKSGMRSIDTGIEVLLVKLAAWTR